MRRPSLHRRNWNAFSVKPMRYPGIHDRELRLEPLEQRCLLTLDFGDAPLPYPTLLAEDGARHEAVGPTLGATRDGELDGAHSASANADGADEDGVSFGPLQVGQTGIIVTEVQGGPARLDAWIDFNANGLWGEAGEQIADNLAVASGYNSPNFQVPTWAVGGTTFARFRLSSAGDLSVGGLAADGEVEDYAVTILLPPPELDLNGPAAGTGYNTTWENAGPVTIAAAAATVVDLDGSNLTSLTATIVSGANANNVLSANTAGTSISQSYNAGTGVLTLSGVDTAAAYQTVLRTVQYHRTAPLGPPDTVTVNFTATDAQGSGEIAVATVVNDYDVFIFHSTIVGRYLFYNQSGTSTRYDGNNLAINASDDNAIATDKTAYLWENPGLATFANISSYTKGINGIMIDIAGTHGSISADDFIFRVGNNNAPVTWATANAPTSISVRAGAGVGGSDRLTIIWNGAAAPINQWLNVIMLANTDTALLPKAGFPAGQGDHFFFGNAVGNVGSGDTVANALVNVIDEAGIRAHPALLSSNIPITNLYDVNRNASVNVIDESAARLNGTNPTTTLKYLDLTGFPNFNFTPWQNPICALDVNADGFISPIDALLIISRLNSVGLGPVPPFAPAPPYFDVNGDNVVSPIDALLIINHLNSNLGGCAVPQTGAANSGTQGSQGAVELTPTGVFYAPNRDIVGTDATDSGVASALTAPAPSSLTDGVPKWLSNRLDNIDLNSGTPARLFQYLHGANTPRSRALLQKFDAVAEALGLDDTLLDSLLADLGLE